jgi:A/G-specific adenine glycosylase
VKEIWNEAQNLLTLSRPADHNQAIMELGATICIPRGPNCPACPVKRWCATNLAFAGTSEMDRRASPLGELSVVSRNSKSPLRQTKREIWCALLQRDGHVQLLQRAKKVSIMPGMWELPQWVKVEEMGRRASSPVFAPWRTFRHSITTTDYRVHVVRTDGAKMPDTKWIAIRDLPAMPITGLTRKILKAAGII